MTRDSSTDAAIETKEDFQAALADLVDHAVHSGVDPRGAYEFESGGSSYAWEVLVVELAGDDGES